MTFANSYKKQNKSFPKALFIKIIVFVIFLSLFSSIFYFRLPFSVIYGDKSAKLIPSNRIDTVGSSAIVMDYNTGEIFWEKNPDALMYPASTTKMMTAILAI